jgi:endonuclease G, mitochondrial
MLVPESVIKQTESRYESSKASIKAVQAINSPLGADNPKRVTERLVRLGANPTQAKSILGGKSLEAIDGLDELTKIGIERLIGKNDLISLSFLSRGMRAAKAVARVEVDVRLTGQAAGYGTGFLVAQRVLITNNHVLETSKVAASSRVRFEYEESVNNQLNPGIEFDLLPDELFFTDPVLDFTVVAVSANSVDGSRALSDFGWLPLYNTPDRHLKAERVNIVQHPGGEKKQLALRENKIIDRNVDFLLYETDTTPGSSGSPVFNDAWEVVALHHSGVPKRDAQRRILKRDGTLYKKGEDDSLIDWIANEGARASRIVEVLEKTSFQGSAKELIDSFLEAKSASIEERKPIAHSKITPPPTNISTDNSPQNPGNNPPDLRQGTATWTIPLEVSIRVGLPTLAAIQDGAINNPPPPVIDVKTTTVTRDPASDPAEVQAALDIFERSRSRKYYDAAQDKQDRDAYYVGINLRANATAMFQALSGLLERTHSNKPRYKPMVELYPWIDLHPNGKLQSIYSGEQFEPVEFIRADFRTEALRVAREMKLREKGATEAEFDLLEATLAFNCEHVVPQSWFGKQEPMRGDLHHLFACESGCNSFRSNTPYMEFDDFGEKIRGKCGKSEGAGFEPESSQGKGVVARATLYFLVRYPGLINANNRELTADKIPMLLEWHQSNPVTEYELHRNQAIFARQGNRNPFIDFPDWVGKVDFKKGLGGR